MNKINYGIEQIAVYLPEQREAGERLLRAGVLSPKEWAELQAQRITSVPIEQERSTLQIMELTLDQLFARGQLQPQKVKYMIAPYLYYSFPYSFDIFRYLRQRYELTDTTCFAVQGLLCSDFLMGLQIAWKLLRNGREADSRAIILSVERCLLDDQRYGGSAFLTGDASVACVIGQGPQHDQILACKNHIDIRTIPAEKFRKKEDSIQDYAFFINLATTLHHSLREAGVKLEDVKLFLPNNTTPSTWLGLAKLLRVPPSRFFTEGHQLIGHMNNCDLLLNYDLACQRGLLASGDVYVMLSLGNGGGVGCAVCRKG
ncbi:3-oxoacyl-[acyl-carrier-protein] synthase III C-terminal domain-containing protein [Brevibacillus fulvus]|uniref:3-oxoacyl-[acyl-carrier-protein] synthase-3 n=1 Tax=Brevibacillus fulvus TaxID=1125967 RepID=A0A938XXF3_9BACL|nr:3-oxoacyl-[acyl-carrier-protein] synthase III C-terminal domain-containing protein [Brevibacillus fulvus]MBM7589661.1 3-oxoacyl-[acyl-carrier-protein] synthase-3 [Brevibacillus fulvus]